MKMPMLLPSVVLVLLMALQLGAGLPQGAPTSVCESMFPKHGVAAQSQPSPYTLASAHTRVTAGDKLRLMVSSPQQLTFEGFMMHALPSNGSRIPIGTFTTVPDQAQKISCGRGKDNSVTHTNTSKKKSLEFEWEAPQNYEGSIIFNCTVAQDFSTFWVGVQSKPVEIRKRSVVNGAQSTGISTTKSPISPTKSKVTGSNNLIYGGCNSNKRCFGTPEGCIKSQNCDIITTVSIEDQQYIFELEGQNSIYSSVGLSDDIIMGDDSVVNCIHDRTGINEVNAYMSWNDGKNNRRLQKQEGVTLLHGSFVDGTVYCRFKREVTTVVQNRTFDLVNKKYHLLIAAGTEIREDASGISFHDVGRLASPDRLFVADIVGSGFTSTPVPTTPESKDRSQDLDTFYNGCNTDKNCFGMPSDCIASRSCKVVVSVLVKGEQFVFELKGVGNTYAAVGLSDDHLMGDDSVMECAYDGTGLNNVNAYMSWNYGRNNKRLGQNGISLIEGSYVDGTVYCKFTREGTILIENNVFDLNNKQYYLLVAAGSLTNGNRNISYHGRTRQASGESQFLANVSGFTPASKLFIKLHGAFMIGAWIGAASVGILLARYFRQTWVGSQLCGKDQWFAWHRMFMLLTWCLTIAAFVLIFLELRDWSTETAHAVLGCITTGLAFLQPIGAAFRPHPGSRRRPIFNWLHWLIGNTAHILGIVTIFLAIKMPKAELDQKLLYYIMVGYVAFHVLMHLILSVTNCISERNSSTRVNTFPMKDMSTSRSPLHPERKEDAPLSCFRKFLLGLYLIVIILLTAVLIVLTVLAPIDPSWENVKSLFTTK